ncbi:fimbrial protein [Acinetobacter sp. YH01022]|uniref:fimbrial protein n=1 Tax=Acinetobacter sp. YH01022 TaxID=2601036 RepID=UPI0015D115C1|nr:fimbrial protein [Acinetobacter sp. YH01022]
MNDKFYILLKLVFVMLLMGITITAQAECFFVDYLTGKTTTTDNNKTTSTNDNAAAKIPIGNLHLYNDTIQPVGTKLAEISVAATEYKIKNVGSDTILWRCDQASDVTYIKFLVATNGDDRVGGHNVVDPDDVGGTSNVYYTWFKGVGIRQKMGNVTLTRTWQSISVIPDGGDVNLKEEDVQNATQCPQNWYCIRLRHIPTLQVEFFKVAGTPPALLNPSFYCDSVTEGGTLGMGESGNYKCGQPSAYIQLADDQLTGTTDNPVQFIHDFAGEDSSSHFDFFGPENGFGYTLYNAAYLVPAANTCWATAANTQTVTLPTTSTTHLDTGGEVFADFQIQIACTGNVTAGLNTGQFAVGIQASQASYTQAKTLGLVNTNQGVTALVSDDYSTNAARAKNVGIFLYKDSGSTLMNFVGQPGYTGSGFPNTTNTGGGISIHYACDWKNPSIPGTGGSTNVCYLGNAINYPNGNDAGWYAFSELTQSSGDKITNIPLRAVLKKLPSAGAVTAGSVLATAHVLVKMQ